MTLAAGSQLAQLARMHSAKHLAIAVALGLALPSAIRSEEQRFGLTMSPFDIILALSFGGALVFAAVRGAPPCSDAPTQAGIRKLRLPQLEIGQKTSRLFQGLGWFAVLGFVAASFVLDFMSTYETSKAEPSRMYVFMGLAAVFVLGKATFSLLAGYALRTRRFVISAGFAVLTLACLSISVVNELSYYSLTLNDYVDARARTTDLASDARAEKRELERRLAKRPTDRSVSEVDEAIAVGLAKTIGGKTLASLTGDCFKKEAAWFGQCKDVLNLRIERSAAERIRKDEERLAQLRASGEWSTVITQPHAGAALIGKILAWARVVDDDGKLRAGIDLMTLLLVLTVQSCSVLGPMLVGGLMRVPQVVTIPSEESRHPPPPPITPVKAPPRGRQAQPQQEGAAQNMGFTLRPRAAATRPRDQAMPRAPADGRSTAGMGAAERGPGSRPRLTIGDHTIALEQAAPERVAHSATFVLASRLRRYLTYRALLFVAAALSVAGLAWTHDTNSKATLACTTGIFAPIVGELIDFWRLRLSKRARPMAANR